MKMVYASLPIHPKLYFYSEKNVGIITFSNIHNQTQISY